MQWRRLMRHLGSWPFGKSVLSNAQADDLARLVAHMEARHRAEIRICLERQWPWAWAASDLPTRERALYWFSHERVWDTEHNTGVLVYVSLADHAIEIVADRGLNAFIQAQQWEGLLEAMRGAFAQQDYFSGLQRGLVMLQTLLDQQLPAAAPSANPNELSNRPMVR